MKVRPEILPGLIGVSGIGQRAGQGGNGRPFAEPLARTAGLEQQLLQLRLRAVLQQGSEPVGLRGKLTSSRLKRHQDLGDKGKRVTTFTLSTRP